MSSMHSRYAVKVVPLVEVQRQELILSQLDEIFFEASSVQEFASPEIREAFRDRWLGRFLRLYPGHAFVALGGEGNPVGYVIGAIEDPAEVPLFEDIGYFADFADLTRHYPAHLHVNVSAGWRNAGVGQVLVDRFVAHAAAERAGGVHVVTSAGARNTRFYDRIGFRELRQLDKDGRSLVFLGRKT